MRSGPEIQAALTAFVTKWSGFTGTEKAEAQTFLNELFACAPTHYGPEGSTTLWTASSAISTDQLFYA